jgi:hypothetical protein
MQTQSEHTKPFALKTWLSGIGRSRKFWYSLDEESKPKHTRTGKLIVVLESPADWFERIRVAGGARTKKRPEATRTAAGA